MFRDGCAEVASRAAVGSVQGSHLLERNGVGIETLEGRGFWSRTDTGFLKRPAWSHSPSSTARGIGAMGGIERVSQKGAAAEGCALFRDIHLRRFVPRRPGSG